MTWLTIRTRLILLTSAGLLVLVATNLYLTRKLADNSVGMVTTAELLKSIEEANNAQIAFGEMRYWMTDLAVSQLTLSERNAAAARVRMEQYLDTLARTSRGTKPRGTNAHMSNNVSRDKGWETCRRR